MRDSSFVYYKSVLEKIERTITKAKLGIKTSSERKNKGIYLQILHNVRVFQIEKIISDI